MNNQKLSAINAFFKTISSSFSKSKTIGCFIIAVVIVGAGVGIFAKTQIADNANPNVKVEVGYRSAVVSWTKINKADAYTITANQNGKNTQQECDGSITRCTIDCLSGCVECLITVEAHVDGACFQLGDAVSVTPEGPSAPEWFMQISDQIIAAAKKTPTTAHGYCAAWVTNVFYKAGYPIAVGNACDMYWRWCREEWSTDRTQLVPGMIIAVPSSPFGDEGRLYGHVGIYIGDNKVMDSTGRVNTRSLDNWIATFGSISKVGWGIPVNEP